MTLSIPLLSFAKVVLPQPEIRPFGDGNFSWKQRVLSRSLTLEGGEEIDALSRPVSAVRSGCAATSALCEGFLINSHCRGAQFSRIQRLILPADLSQGQEEAV